MQASIIARAAHGVLRSYTTGDQGHLGECCNDYICGLTYPSCNSHDPPSSIERVHQSRSVRPDALTLSAILAVAAATGATAAILHASYGCETALLSGGQDREYYVNDHKHTLAGERCNLVAAAGSCRFMASMHLANKRTSLQPPPPSQYPPCRPWCRCGHWMSPATADVLQARLAEGSTSPANQSRLCIATDAHLWPAIAGHNRSTTAGVMTVGVEL